MSENGRTTWTSHLFPEQQHDWEMHLDARITTMPLCGRNDLKGVSLSVLNLDKENPWKACSDCLVWLDHALVHGLVEIDTRGAAVYVAWSKGVLLGGRVLPFDRGILKSLWDWERNLLKLK